MKRRLVSPAVTVAVLSLPAGQAFAATAQSGMTGGSGGMMMSSADMMAGRTTAAMRKAAALKAKLMGKPTYLEQNSAFSSAKGPDYFGSSPNYASSPMPEITWATTANGHTAGGIVILPVYDPTNGLLTDPSSSTNAVVSLLKSPFQEDPQNPGQPLLDPVNDMPQLDYAKVNIAGGIRKFVEPLPGIDTPAANATLKNYSTNANGSINTASATTSYIPTAVPNTTMYPGSDYYEIGLKDYYQQFSPDLPPTKLRGYFQINHPSGVQRPFYLGPNIVAQANVPVRVKFVNMLDKGEGGNLFLPVDTTAMGASTGQDMSTPYNQNRANIHLHGGLTPWISDGTPNQWTTPAGDTTKYPKGVSVVGVPDMPDISGPTDSGAKNDGTMTFYYTNKQSARLMWYHDHTYGMTRLNVYAGEVSTFKLQDAKEKALIASGVLPHDEYTLAIQDKTFVPSNKATGYFPDGQLKTQDPTWDTVKWSDLGGLWFPHVYMPNQNPDAPDHSGANAMGRWDYGPWFWPVFGTKAGLAHGEIDNPYFSRTNPTEPPKIPGTPSTYVKAQALASAKKLTDAYNALLKNSNQGRGQSNSIANAKKAMDQAVMDANMSSDVSQVPEAYVDTPVVNGVAYPYLDVKPQAYRFRILNSSNDRYWNLQMYCSAADKPTDKSLYRATGAQATTNTASMWLNTSQHKPQNAAAGEVPMVPATKGSGLPSDWPTDGREGGVPSPAAAVGNFLQIGTESGVLPNVATIHNGPVTYVYNRRDIVVLNTEQRALFLGPAERADVVYDFSAAAAAGCKNVILYNDSPTPVPAFDPRNDYYSNNVDQTETGGAPSTIPGYGPNTRTIMQFRLDGSTPHPFDTAALEDAVPKWFAQTQPKPIVPSTAFAAAYPGDPIGQSDVYSTIQANSLSFPTSAGGSLSGVNLTNSGGAGYAPVCTLSASFGTGGTKARLQPIISPTGVVTGVQVIDHGSKYPSTTTITISKPINGVAATGTLVFDTNGGVKSVVITNGGSGYTTGASVTIAEPLSGELVNPYALGRGAQAKAVIDYETGKISAIVLSEAGDQYLSAPAVSISAPLYDGGTQATATSSMNSKSVSNVTINMEPKAIQELFEMNFGRMNATLGVEMPFTNSTTQTTMPMGYAAPATEALSPSQVGVRIGTANDGTAIWKITHNGVDTHTIHFHLFDVQLINRVGWDGAIRPPDDNETGWKESVRMNPLEDAIVAMRPVTPELPFKIGDSIRQIDPTMPESAQIATYDQTTGQPDLVSNAKTNYGWEYIWHCHLLGHEENDMMRPVVYAGSPTVATNVKATAGSSGGAFGQVNVTWSKTNYKFATNYVVQRSTTSDFSNAVQTLSDTQGITGGSAVNWQGTHTTLGGVVPATASSFADQSVDSGVTYYYRVRAEGASGYSPWSSSVTVKAPTFPDAAPGPAAPTNVTITAGRQSINVRWTSVNGVSYRVQSATNSTFTQGLSNTTNTNTGANSTTLNGLRTGTTYYVRIQSSQGGLTSAWVNSTPASVVVN